MSDIKLNLLIWIPLLMILIGVVYSLVEVAYKSGYQDGLRKYMDINQSYVHDSEDEMWEHCKYFWETGSSCEDFRETCQYLQSKRQGHDWFDYMMKGMVI